MIEDELRRQVEEEEKLKQTFEKWLEYVLDEAEDVQKLIHVERKRDKRVLHLNYSAFYDWSAQTGAEAPEFPPEGILVWGRKLYAKVFESDEPDELVITSLPSYLYPWQIHLQSVPLNRVVAVRGLVTISPFRTFFRLCVKAVCPNEEGDEELKLVCGNFWNNEEPKLQKPCIPISQHPLYRGLDADVKVSVLQFELTDPPYATEMKNPYKLSVYAIDHFPLVGLGDTLEVIGVLRAKKRGRVGEPALEYISHTVYSERELKLTKKQREALQRLMKMQFPENFHALVASYAPKLWGLWEAKAIALLSSVLKPEFSSDDDRPTVLHVLLAGDRATGKSTLLQQTAKYVKPSIVLSARTVTMPGLLMSAVVLEGGMRTYQAGVIIQHKEGLVGIEEAKDNAQEVEKALLDYADKGEVGRGTAVGSVSVRVPTTLMLTTNPADGRWNDAVTLLDNLRFFSPAFLSRFVIVVTRHSTKAEVYGAVLNALEKSELEKSVPFTEEEVAGIIVQLRSLPNPPLSQQAKKELIRLMVQIAKSAQSADTPVSLRDERRLRLMAQAIAKIDGSSTVEPKHVRLAFEIWKQVLMTHHGLHYAEVVNLSSPEEPKKAVVQAYEALYRALDEVCTAQQEMGSVEGVTVSELVQHLRNAYPEAYEKLKDEAERSGKIVDEFVRRRLLAFLSEGRVYKRGNRFCTLPI